MRLDRAYERMMAVAVAALHEREPERLWPMLAGTLAEVCGGEAVIHKLDDWSESTGTVGTVPDAAAAELARLGDADLGLLRAGYPFAGHYGPGGDRTPVTAHRAVGRTWPDSPTARLLPRGPGRRPCAGRAASGERRAGHRMPGVPGRYGLHRRPAGTGRTRPAAAVGGRAATAAAGGVAAGAGPGRCSGPAGGGLRADPRARPPSCCCSPMRSPPTRSAAASASRSARCTSTSRTSTASWAPATVSARYCAPSGSGWSRRRLRRRPPGPAPPDPPPNRRTRVTRLRAAVRV